MITIKHIKPLCHNRNLFRSPISHILKPCDFDWVFRKRCEKGSRNS